MPAPDNSSSISISNLINPDNPETQENPLGSDPDWVPVENPQQDGYDLNEIMHEWSEEEDYDHLQSSAILNYSNLPSVDNNDSDSSDEDDDDDVGLPVRHPAFPNREPYSPYSRTIPPVRSPRAEPHNERFDSDDEFTRSLNVRVENERLLHQLRNNYIDNSELLDPDMDFRLQHEPEPIQERTHDEPNIIRSPTSNNRNTVIIGTRRRNNNNNNSSNTTHIIPSISIDIMNRTSAIHRGDYNSINRSNDTLNHDSNNLSRTANSLNSLLSSVSRMERRSHQDENRRVRINNNPSEYPSSRPYGVSRSHNNNINDDNDNDNDGMGSNMSRSIFDSHDSTHELIYKPVFANFNKRLNEFLNKRQQQGYIYDSFHKHKRSNPLKRSFDELGEEKVTGNYNFNITRVSKNSFLSNGISFKGYFGSPIGLVFENINYESNSIIGNISMNTRDNFEKFWKQFNPSSNYFPKFLKSNNSYKLNFIGNFINFEKNDLRYFKNDLNGLSSSKNVTLLLEKEFTKWLSLSPFIQLNLEELMSVILCPDCIINLQKKFILFTLNCDKLTLLCSLNRGDGTIELINGNLNNYEEIHSHRENSVTLKPVNNLYTSSGFDLV